MSLLPVNGAPPREPCEGGTLVRVNQGTILTIVSRNVGKLWQMQCLVVCESSG